MRMAFDWAMQSIEMGGEADHVLGLPVPRDQGGLSSIQCVDHFSNECPSSPDRSPEGLISPGRCGAYEFGRVPLEDPSIDARNEQIIMRAGCKIAARPETESLVQPESFVRCSAIECCVDDTLLHDALLALLDGLSVVGKGFQVIQRRGLDPNGRVHLGLGISGNVEARKPFAPESVV